MLPESKFPVTGGTIMQTEEVVPRAQSTGIDGALTDSTALQHQLHHSSRIKCTIPPLIHMAVKQEPQEEEERSRDTSTLSPETDADIAPSSIDGKHAHVQQSGHHRSQGLEENPGQTIPDLGSRGRPSRGRRKSRWKLKFHHQALPPEYLDHYEASLAQEALNSSPTHIAESTAPSPAPTIAASTPSPIADVHGWLQRIAAMQQELCSQPLPPQCPDLSSAQTLSSRRSVITSTSSHAHNSSHQSQNHNQQQQQQAPSRPPMKYSDLPYMGEITLDNSKPRRGRKPKKADICHLIYKNYGTILPGTPGHEERRLSPRDKLDCRDQLQAQMPFQRTDVQNRISSLLEKRLTQESRRSFVPVECHREQEEPLNLCIRDLNQLKIRLLRRHGSVYESDQVKSEASSDGEDVECIGTSYHDPLNRCLEPTNHATNNVNHNNNIIDPMLGVNPGFVYWPNAGVFIHPVALQSQLMYYQKMAQNEKCSVKGADHPPKEQKIVPKSIYSMLDTKCPVSASSPTHLTPLPVTPSAQTVPVPPPVSPRPKRNASIGQAQSQPTKRKRSAIFIPPMPTENNNNPATEVSICKFKFTGGAKPSLQEKKSLSVDSGGNFRYYSGTGDKSMRGYEFFPREALQQPAGQSGSSAGAFLSAAGERVQPVVCQRTATQDDGRRKRKTRKSLQREKLEQTFKEKGFLIQTQQLESAEGATYCKFRQLRKFTRYLFRSWKDYLPGNVRELTGTVDSEMPDGDADGDVSAVSSPVSHSNVVDVPPGFVDDHRTLPLT